jgi:hypothetical protein
VKTTRLLPLFLLTAAMAGCSDDNPAATDTGSTSSVLVADTTTTTATPTTTSTTIPVTTAAPTSTTTSTTTTTSSTTTSTTVAPGAELVLRPNGLGDAAFGAEPDGVIAYVSSIIGAPTVDTGWVDPLSVGACPGTELRQVSWADLVLEFTDESSVTSGRRHFFSYQYGPTFGQHIAPAGLKTDAGIGVGSTVAELTGTYPSAVINPGDDFGGPNFFINDGLAGFLTGVNPTDTVTSVLGGQGCGE